MKKIILVILVIILLSGCEYNFVVSNSSKVESTVESSISSTIESTIIIPSSSSFAYDKNSIFASPNGNGNGTLSNPFSLKMAISFLSKEKTLYLLGGTYKVDSVINLTKIGNEDNYYKIFAFNNEKVVFDYGHDYRQNPTVLGNYNSSNSKGIVLSGSYYHLKGIEITNCRSTGLQISGHYNIVEDCVFSYNGNTGCNISGSSSKTLKDWPHDNLIKNCTSYANFDWDRFDNVGEDADGFAAKLTSGVNNVFDGCISYNNSDDGWDLFTKHKTGVIGEVTIKNCVAFNNGYSMTGEELKNGNGFKLGGRALEVSHTVENCVAFFNKANGFDDNSNPGTITLKDCTSYKNGKRNYAMGRFLEEENTYTSTWYEGNDLFGPISGVAKSHNYFENCISYKSGEKDSYSGYAKNCYFDNLNSYYSFNDGECNSKYIVGKSVGYFDPFISTNINLDLENIHVLYRNLDGRVNLNGFLKIKDTINIGANL